VGVADNVQRVKRRGVSGKEKEGADERERRMTLRINLSSTDFCPCARDFPLRQQVETVVSTAWRNLDASVPQRVYGSNHRVTRN